MKQHITIDQLNELSEKGEGKLRKWWGDGHAHLEWDNDPDARFVLMLDIGEMIEFLDEYAENDRDYLSKPVKEWPSLKKGKGSEEWYWVTNDNWLSVPGFGMVFGEKFTEACDALWEAVKEVLEK
jgi:hypothetical protein